MTEYYNTGHFENGVWIPDCTRCGACCRYLFYRASTDKEYFEFDSFHGVKTIGHVAYVPAPCRFLTTTGCSIHEDEERPDCCKRFGKGGHHHPIMCQFFGGETDKLLYPDDYRHNLQE